ncbi:MAG: bifunctional [glutamate--ammonia ligase]-adenylyl-L-tyrosine phosphorylase/[glutamate--ammonia-ligase] adenylyltransferase, partial [Gemmataceae bacterium]
MHADQLRLLLASPDGCRPHLAGWNVRDAARGVENLRAIADHVTPESLAALWPALGRLLPRCPEPDMALNNLERFFAHPAGPPLAPALLEARARPLEILLGLFATSQMFSDLLAQHPDHLEMVRVPLRRSPSTAELRDGLRAEAESAFEDSAVLRAFRRFRHRQLLRIGTNDIIRDRPLDEITRDISRVADVAIEAALEAALRHVTRRFGEPLDAAGAPIPCAVFAFGKLGGEELNYSSDIDLMLLYGDEGQTHGKGVSVVPADEFFGRVVEQLVRLLGGHTELGQGYRVDLRLRPEGQRGPLTRSVASALSYYDTMGRTWERQALIKLRPVAGDAALGERFVRAVEPFVYRKYLSFSEINEIKALKRQIEQKTRQAGEDGREVKTGRGGIRDIEFTIQFLQLLNGGDLPGLRQRNTLMALAALEEAGALTDQEYRKLEDAYRFLRKTEHRLQLLFDLQTHRLPEDDAELGRLSLRMGYGLRRESAASRPGRRRGRPQPPRPDDETARAAVPAAPPRDPREAFLHDYRDKTAPTRAILEFLLHQTFGGPAQHAEPETDLLLDPDPDPQTVAAVLGRYPFRDVSAAYANLVALTQEVPFLSPRRCRHFLASIAPALLRAVAETPDPDLALLNLEKVTASLGAKTVLWELFSFNPPSLRLYVDLCASSQYLSEILINNPGMIDELLDSLVLNQPRALGELCEELQELSRGATDPEPILHSFQDTQLLRLGVRDILGKQTIRETTAGLSDLAEAILVQVARNQYFPVEVRHGMPLLEGGPRAGQPVRVAIVGLGKLGAREMNYHSDLDLLVVYEGEGRSYPTEGSRAEPTDAGLFYTEFAQRMIKALSHSGPMGRLYQVDMRLRPAGRS